MPRHSGVYLGTDYSNRLSLISSPDQMNKMTVPMMYLELSWTVKGRPLWVHRFSLGQRMLIMFSSYVVLLIKILYEGGHYQQHHVFFRARETETQTFGWDHPNIILPDDHIWTSGICITRQKSACRDSCQISATSGWPMIKTERWHCWVLFLVQPFSCWGRCLGSGSSSPYTFCHH